MQIGNLLIKFEAMKHLGLALLLIVAASAQAQVNNTPLEDRNDYSPEKFKTLDLHIYNLNFQRNYEYYNSFADGYTLFGYQLMPTLTYFANQKIKVEGGVLVNKNFGQRGYSRVQPVYSLSFTDRNFTLKFGSIDGGLKHQYIQPMYDLDKALLNPIENGIQFLYKKPKFFFDGWLDWALYIEPYSTFNEVLRGGFSSYYKPFINPGGVEVKIPLQLIVQHTGGQIDTTRIPVETTLNGAVGIEIEQTKPMSRDFYRGFSLKAYLLGFNTVPFRNLRPFKDGNAVFLNASLKTAYFELMLSYWKGNEFISVIGEPVMQSVSSSIHKPGLFQGEREIVFVRILQDIQLAPNLFLSARFEPYIDLNDPKLEFSNSLFLSWKGNFRLKKFD
jgi:hypothetical protein